MQWRYLLILLGGILLVTLQYGLISFLPFPFSAINILMLTLVLIYFLTGKLEKVLFLAIWSSFIKDVFSPAVFGINGASLLVTLILTKWFFEYFFTNRTLLSLLFLDIFFMTSFSLTFLMLNAIVAIKYNSGAVYSVREFFLYYTSTTVTSLIILAFSFAIINQFSDRLKNDFLIRKT